LAGYSDCCRHRSRQGRTRQTGQEVLLSYFFLDSTEGGRSATGTQGDQRCRIPDGMALSGRDSRQVPRGRDFFRLVTALRQEFFWRLDLCEQSCGCPANVRGVGLGRIWRRQHFACLATLFGDGEKETLEDLGSNRSHHAWRTSPSGAGCGKTVLLPEVLRQPG
jgi:hypothetical protein